MKTVNMNFDKATKNYYVFREDTSDLSENLGPLLVAPLYIHKTAFPGVHRPPSLKLTIEVTNAT